MPDAVVITNRFTLCLQTAVLVATPGALAEVLSPPQPQPVLDAARFLVIDEVDACLAVSSTLRRQLVTAYRTAFCFWQYLALYNKLWFLQGNICAAWQS